MKTALLCVAVVGATILTGCVVLPSPPPLVSVGAPVPVVYSPGYSVRTLPSGYRTTYYGRRTYYVHRNVYYQRQSRGYVVVRRPY